MPSENDLDFICTLVDSFYRMNERKKKNISFVCTLQFLVFFIVQIENPIGGKQRAEILPSFALWGFMRLEFHVDINFPRNNFCIAATTRNWYLVSGFHSESFWTLETFSVGKILTIRDFIPINLDRILLSWIKVVYEIPFRSQYS